MSRRWEKRIDVVQDDGTDSWISVKAMGAHRRLGWVTPRQLAVTSPHGYVTVTPQQARAMALALMTLADEVEAQPETVDTEVSR